MKLKKNKNKIPHYSSRISSQSTSTSQEDEMEIHCDESANNTEYYEEGSDVDEPPIPKVKKAKLSQHTCGTIWIQSNVQKYPRTSMG